MKPWTLLGDRSEHPKSAIIGALLSDHQTGQQIMSKEQARTIQEHLINEIPGEGFLEMGKEGFAYSDKYMRELRHGDPLLIK